MDTTPKPKNSPAFIIQSALTFGLTLVGMFIAIVNFPVDPWQRAFLAVTTLFLASSSFTLAKCIRDFHERHETYQRLDQARVDRILAEHDPYNSPAWPHEAPRQ